MNTIELIGPWRVYAGHGYGLRGPFVIGALRWSVKPKLSMPRVLQQLLPQQPMAPELVASLHGQKLDFAGFLQLFLALETAQGNPFAQRAQIIAIANEYGDQNVHQVAFATQHASGTLALLQWLVLNVLQVHQTHKLPSINPSLPQLLATSSRFATSINGGGVNNQRIIKAAIALDIPVKMLPDSIMLVGTGRYAQWFRSTITERTPSLGVFIAKKKSLTAQFLRMHGLPAPNHQTVHAGDIDNAVAIAASIGYPVVVKPDDRDGGSGVHAGLADEFQFRECFRRAAEASPNLLVEQHIVGDDYRITVVDGQVVKVIGRRPGGVVGDGVRTIRDIIAADAANIKATQPGRKTVEFDEEARSVLAVSGRSADDVLPAGAFQPLRRRANMSTGGTSHDVRDIIHPDNVQLAIRAAQALRLDIAGIDLIIPDIERSWLDVGGAICEVNSQPQISTEFADDVYVNLLRQRLPGRFRMRTVLLVSCDDSYVDDADLERVATELTSQGETVVCIKDSGTWLEGQRIAPLESTRFRAAALAELNIEGTAVVTCLSWQTLLENGCPWYHIDHLCWVGVKDVPDGTNLERLMEWKRLENLLLAHTVDTPAICKSEQNGHLSTAWAVDHTVLSSLNGWPFSLNHSLSVHGTNVKP